MKQRIGVLGMLGLLFGLSICLPLQTIAQALGPLPPVPVPADNPMTPAKIELGTLLFFDPRLSGDGSLSCASCHLPEQGYSTNTPQSPAYPSNAERRHSMTLINVAYNPALIWDGRAPNLEKQALGPVKNPIHMNQNVNLLVAKLHAIPGYVQRFQAVFGGGPSPATIARALAAFERTLVTRNAPFDRYVKGDKDALSAAAVRGLALFQGKARCVVCHNGPNFTDGQFHNLGLPAAPYLTQPLVQATIRFDAQRMKVPAYQKVTTDLGRYLVTKNDKDIGAFKTPTLRNATDRGSFMHNGAFTTLAQVIDFYDSGGTDDPHKSPLMQPLHLSISDKQDLLAFLRSLAGELPRVTRPPLPPYAP